MPEDPWKDEASELINHMICLLKINQEFILSMFDIIQVYADQLPVAFLEGTSYLTRRNTEQLQQMELKE